MLSRTTFVVLVTQALMVPEGLAAPTVPVSPIMSAPAINSAAGLRKRWIGAWATVIRVSFRAWTCLMRDKEKS